MIGTIEARDGPAAAPRAGLGLRRAAVHRYGGIAAITLALCTWAPARPCAAADAAGVPDAVLGAADARHLLARTGFGPTLAEVQAYALLTRAEAVAKLLRETRTTAVTPPPPAMLEPGPLQPVGGANATAEQRREFLRQQTQQGLALRGWWLQEMLATPSPLTERMTLFWHGHFASAQAKVRVARLMYLQNTTLRANALGSFSTLLHAIARDPAMVVYLDSARNRKGAPNENFAREVMELFTLGEGRYTEQDVKEAARAFTGWSLDRDTGLFVLRRALHDDGVKTVFGASGRYDGDALLELLLARPETAQTIVTKLWREFVSPEPEPREVERIARGFRAAHYDIATALALLLSSDAFWATENRGVLVKSPVELVVGSLRQLGAAPGDPLPFAVAAAGMGQNLFAPPNVKGWPGGEAWINTATLLARKQFLDRLTRGVEMASPPATMSPADAPRTDAALAAARPENAPRPRAGATADPSAARDDAAADALRQQRFQREMQRGLSSIRLDVAAWLTAMPGDTAVARTLAAQELLLPLPPLQPPDPVTGALAQVRSLVQDATFQLK